MKLMTSPAERARRRNVCVTCPHVQMVAKKPILCGACGCPLATKTRFKRATCPVGKW